MTHIWQGLRSGDWLTDARMRGYSLILLAICTLALVGWIAASDGLIDRNSKPIGTDFSNVYAAGTLIWQGRPAEAYEPARQRAAERAVFGPAARCRSNGWLYPSVLLCRRVFWWPPFRIAWSRDLACASFAAYLAAMRAIVPRPEKRC